MLPSRIHQAKSPLQMPMSTSPPFLEYPFYLMHVLLPPQFEYPFLSATLKDLLYLQIKVRCILKLLNQLLNGCRKPWCKLKLLENAAYSKKDNVSIHYNFFLISFIPLNYRTEIKQNIYSKLDIGPRAYTIYKYGQ